MADVGGKQISTSIENADTVRNDAALPTDDSCDRVATIYETDTIDERVVVMASDGIIMSSEADDQQTSGERVENADQSVDSSVAGTAKLTSQRRKRTSVNKQLASADAETPLKRRRVQHNYRRLSSAGYVDDYDGRERFSGKKSTQPMSAVKSKAASSTSRPTTSKTRSQSVAVTTAGQG